MIALRKSDKPSAPMALGLGGDHWRSERRDANARAIPGAACTEPRIAPTDRAARNVGTFVGTLLQKGTKKERSLYIPPGPNKSLKLLPELHLAPRNAIPQKPRTQLLTEGCPAVPPGQDFHRDNLVRHRSPATRTVPATAKCGSVFLQMVLP